MGDQNLLSRAAPGLAKHVKPFVPATFAVVSTQQPALGIVVSYGPFSLCVIHKEGLCPNSGDINGLKMMMNIRILSGIKDYWVMIQISDHSAKLSMILWYNILYFIFLVVCNKQYILSANKGVSLSNGDMSITRFGND
jgi:hypothetical protein